MSTSIDAPPAADTEQPPVEYGSPGLAQLLDAIHAGAFERERDNVAPFEAIELVRQARLGALRVPRELGGAGASLRELFSVVIALAAADPNVAHILRAHFWFVEARRSSPDEQERARWLSEVARGAIFGNASTEIGPRDTGAYDAAAFETLVAPAQDGEGFVLNGTKYYSTGSLYSDWIAVIGATPDERLVSAIVPANADGVTLEDDWDGIGQRLTGTGTTRLADVRLAPDQVIDESARAHLGSYASPFLQLYLMALLAGILRATVDDAAALVRRRERNFTHASAARPADDPLLQQVVGEISSAAFAAEAIVLAAADAVQAAADSQVDGALDPELVAEASLRVSQAKVVIDEFVQRAGWRIFDVGGASATKQSHNLDRHWRNARTVTAHNPTVYKARAIGDLVINAEPLPAELVLLRVSVRAAEREEHRPCGPDAAVRRPGPALRAVHRFRYSIPIRSTNEGTFRS